MVSLFMSVNFILAVKSFLLKSSLLTLKDIGVLRTDFTLVRDVTFSKDFPPRRGGNAPVNWAIALSIAIDIKQSQTASELLPKRFAPFAAHIV